MTTRERGVMDGRTALVTGASRGIGAGVAELLARHGAAVGVNYHRSEDRARQVVDTIRADGGTAVALQGDVRDEQQVATMHEELRTAAGAVDTVVLNAVDGTGFAPQPLLDGDLSEPLEQTADQIRMCLVPLRAIVPSMVENGGGSITAIGSGLVRTPVAGMGAVTAGKSAVASVMRTLALELGPQSIRVNVVSPGMVLTELNDFLPEELKSEHADSTPLRRNATPEDVAGAVLAMASGHAGFVTGADLPVNGGAAIG